MRRWLRHAFMSLGAILVTTGVSVTGAAVYFGSQPSFILGLVGIVTGAYGVYIGAIRD